MQAELQEAKEKVDAWLAEGNIALADGRVEEAMAIADSALESNPLSIEGLALKSMCCERLGKVAEALLYAEKVVELNPDSELDKIRRNNLRSNLGSVLQVTDKVDRRIALTAAIAAAVTFLAAGIGIAHNYRSQADKVAQNDAPPTTVERPATFGGQNQPGSSNLYALNPNGQQPVNPGLSPQPNSNPPAQRQTQDTDDSSDRPALPKYEGSLPNATSDGTMVINPITPLVGPSSGIPLSNPSESHPKVDGSNDGDPAPDVDTSASATTNSPAVASTTQANAVPANDDPGYIEIKVHQPAKTLVGGTEPIGGSIDRNGVEALARTGTQQYLIGSYSAAATSFEKALKGGGDPISLNKYLGLTYAGLGRTSDAISAYERAISACQSAMTAGRGNKTRIQSVMDACEQAIKVLGG
jgi:tetratricopeptide (TPR) repeat protein